MPNANTTSSVFHLLLTPEKGALVKSLPEAELDAPPLPEPAQVRIVTKPDTVVFADNKPLGRQPLTVTLPAGRSTLVFQNDALALRRVVWVELAPGEKTTLQRTFGKGWLRVVAPPSSVVTVDGRRMTGSEIQAWEGLHRIDIVHADKAGSRESQTIELAAGQTAGVYFRPPADRRR